jgi:hypothetical protein
MNDSLNGHKLTLSPKLACLVGLNEAIVLSQLNYWMNIYKEKKSEKHYRDGRWWVYNSIRQWREDNFPWWCEATIRRAFEKLRELGIVIVGNYNKFGGDHTLWYTIDYDALLQYEQARLPDSDSRQVQDDKAEDDNLSKAVPETTTDYPEDTTLFRLQNDEKLTGEALLDQYFGGRKDPTQPVEMIEGGWAANFASKPWVKCATWLRGRDGISAESLQRVYWLLEHHTGLEPTEDERAGWVKALAMIYKATDGDFDAIQRGIHMAWEREPKYRPGHARGFVNEVRKAALDVSSARDSEFDRFKQQMEQDPQVLAFRKLREQRERKAAGDSGDLAVAGT